MSTPIKPPGAGPTGPAAPDSLSGPSAESRPGEFLEQVRAASGSGAASAAAPTAAARAPHVAELEAALAQRQLDAHAATERLVERALASAQGLPAAHREALAAQLREALAEDPTLAALQKDLHRASTL